MAFDQRLPIYTQLAAKIKKDMVSGRYELGQPLPSRRELAQQFKVNPNTIQRALKNLTEEGLITTIPQVGSSVTSDPAVIDQLKHTLMQESLTAFIEEMKTMKISDQEIIDALEAKLQERKDEPHA